MAKSSTLNMLIDMARNDTDEAARELAKLVKARHDAQQQLDALHSYRKDYAERLQEESKSGLTASNYHNFRQFIATLDDAISQQNKVVAQIDARIEQDRQHWYAEKRRVNSFEALQTRDKRLLQLRENRAEQRANDEISANLYRRE